ncbi:hypothetical protein HK101_011074 [Irineochytrium annulatum]|nr:hypothetical protein HK101_011074 [Irineochytrium annulatum]
MVNLIFVSSDDGSVTCEKEDDKNEDQIFTFALDSKDKYVIESWGFKNHCFVDSDHDAKLIIAPCDGTGDKHGSYGYTPKVEVATWKFKCSSDGETVIFVSDSGRCIDDYGATDDSVSATTYPCDEEQAHQHWFVKTVEVGNYYKK